MGQTVLAKLGECISVKDFGAVGDGVTDDTDAIQDAIDACVTGGKRLMGVPGTYLVTDTLQMNASGDLSEMTINADGTTVSPVIRVGNASATPARRLQLQLPTVVNTAKDGTGWSGFSTSIGVELATLFESIITVKQIKYFGVGLSCGGYDEENCAYNTIHVGFLNTNKINLQLSPGTSDGVCNENLFLGGRLYMESSEGTGVADTRHIYIAKATHAINNNIFIRPSIEGNVPEYHVECGGSYNTILQGRWEATTPTVHYIADNVNQAIYNTIAYGYNAQGITFSYTVTGGGGGNTLLAGQHSVFTTDGHYFMNNTSSANDIHRFFDTSSSVLPDTEASGTTAWTMKHGSRSLVGKRSGDTEGRLKLDHYNGRVYLGPGGTTALAEYLEATTSGFLVGGTGFVRLGILGITDGVTAPGTVAGYAQIYVDVADGDLKVKFGDGTVKTLTADT